MYPVEKDTWLDITSLLLSREQFLIMNAFIEAPSPFIFDNISRPLSLLCAVDRSEKKKRESERDSGNKHENVLNTEDLVD